MRRFLAAVRFLTILPVPGRWGTSEADLAGSVPLFPLVGLLLGAMAGAVGFGVSLVAPPLVSAALVVVVLLGLSGGLHLDGLSDTADGFLSSRPREQVLEIMRDSHVGAMGVIAIASTLLVKFTAFASVPRASLWAAALLTPLAGRTAMVIQMAAIPYVRASGLGSVFASKRSGPAAVLSVVVLAATCVLLFRVKGLIVAAGCVVVAIAFAGWCRRKIGGATGDTYGAASELVEVVPALMLAVWPLPVGGRLT